MDNMVTTYCNCIHLVFVIVCTSNNHRFGFNAGSTESIEGTSLQYAHIHNIMYIPYNYMVGNFCGVPIFVDFVHSVNFSYITKVHHKKLSELQTTKN